MSRISGFFRSAMEAVPALGNRLLAKEANFVTTRAASSEAAYAQAYRNIQSLRKKAELGLASKEDFFNAVEQLHHNGQILCGRTIRHPFGSDTGSSIVPRVLAAQMWSETKGKVLGFDPKVFKHEEGVIKSLFTNPDMVDYERDAQLARMKVFFTSSTTQANKVAITAVGNINSAMGEIALASEHSHIFAFEVGQPAEKVIPQDQISGKLTTDDLEKYVECYSALGKRVKVVHLDQPTNGDYFYSENEIRDITTWAHSRGMVVTMDIERTVNYLPLYGRGSYYDLTAKCGVDVVTFGMQKNGGARSSSVVVLDDTHISDARALDLRVRSFFRLLGDVTNNKSFIVAGWSEMVENETYKENAARANSHSKKIADVIANYNFAHNALGRDLMSNYPPTTNMIFTKFPSDFVALFNNFVAQIGNQDLAMHPSRKGITRIVSSHDVTEDEVNNFIGCLNKTYEVYSRINKGENKEKCFSEAVESFKKEQSLFPALPLDIAERQEIVLQTLQNLVSSAEKFISSVPVSSLSIGRKTSMREAPRHVDLMTAFFMSNMEGHHTPYGNDSATSEAAAFLRKKLDASDNAAVVFTSSKSQSISCLTKLVQSTANSLLLVSPGSAPKHVRFGRGVKPVELSGKYEEEDKLNPRSVNSLLTFHNSLNGQHVPFLTGVLLQNPTSKGYVYTREEVKALSEVSHKHHVPLVMELDGLSYEMARRNMSFADYIKDCGIDAVTIGFQGLGGSPSSAIVVLDKQRLRWQEDDLLMVLRRIVKENGGLQSTSLAYGWPLIDRSWRQNAQKVNDNVDHMIGELKKFEFDGKPLEFQNDNPAHNIIAVKLPRGFIHNLNKKGYEFKEDVDGYLRFRLPYHLTKDEVGKFLDDFKEVHKNFGKGIGNKGDNDPSSKPSRTSVVPLSTKEISHLLS